MRTALSGTRSVRIFVASRPSIPGMRTSMITTFGLRRSASSTAASPSAASPITRMCGARLSDRRSPSRTTSWSSTIRVVISGSATAPRFYGGGPRLHSESELLGRFSRLKPDAAAVADPVLAGERAHFFAYRIDLAAWQVRAAAVHLLVAWQQLGPVPLERREEVLARARLKVEDVRPDPRRSRGARFAHDFGEQLGLVAQAGEYRRHPDSRLHSRGDELFQRAKPLARWSSARLCAPPDLVVERRDGERHGHLRAARRFRKHIDVANDERPTGDDRERARRVAERLDARASQPVAALRRLVRIGRRAEHDGLPLPARPRELAAEHVGDVRLDADARAVAVVPRPVGACLERTDVTERALVDTAHVRVERPGEGHPAYAVESVSARLLAVVDAHSHADSSEHMFVLL